MQRITKQIILLHFLN